MITKGKSLHSSYIWGTCKEGTAETLFNNIDSILREKKVD